VQYQKWKNYSASKAMHQIENCRKRAFGSNNITEVKIWQLQINSRPIIHTKIRKIKKA